ncbi:hypothetical protein IWW48_004033 [Coemansia sp. RSA 1200]|nr:hypothetical protein IWW48_004033 [Coemansia sp. RSA 1200]
MNAATNADTRTLLAPANWPAHIIRTTLAYAIGEGLHNHVRYCLLPNKAHATDSNNDYDINDEYEAGNQRGRLSVCSCCMCASQSAVQISSVMSVCRTWRHIGQTVVAEQMCVDLGDEKDHYYPSTESTVPIATMKSAPAGCLVRKYCSLAAVAQNCLHRAVQRAVVRLPLECVRTGEFVDRWNVEKGSDRLDVFPAVRALGVCVYWARDVADTSVNTPTEEADNEGEGPVDAFEINGSSAVAVANRKMVQRAVSHLLRVFPNASAVELQNAKIRSPAGSAMVSALYQMLIVQTAHNRDFIANNSNKNNSSGALGPSAIAYSALHKLAHVNRLPLVVGLTSLTINQVVHSASPTIQLATTNARTLERLDLTLGMSFLASSLILDDQQNPVSYPRLQWLQLAVYGGVPFIYRHACYPQAFPQLRHLRIPGVFPFSNGRIITDCAKTLESLCLGVSAHMYDPFALHMGINFASYPNLKDLELCTLAAEDPFLVPNITEDEAVYPLPSAYYTMAFSLGAAASRIKLSFGGEETSLLSKAALFDTLDQPVPTMTNITVLDLVEGCTALNFYDIRLLVCRLMPALTHLLCQADASESSPEPELESEFNAAADSCLKELSMVLCAGDELKHRFTEKAHDATDLLFKQKKTSAVIYQVDAESQSIDAVKEVLGIPDKSINTIGENMDHDQWYFVVLHLPVIKGLAHKSVYSAILYAPDDNQASRELYESAVADLCAQLPQNDCTFRISEWSSGFGRETIINKMTEISGGRGNKWR